jgi:TPR repeat protein
MMVRLQIDAFYQMALANYYGYAIHINYNKVFEYFEQIEDDETSLDISDAQNYLGIYYQYGKGC